VTVSAVDGDLADNGHVTYVLAGTNPARDVIAGRGLFVVNASTGEVRLTEMAASGVSLLDRETISMYRLTVIAHDHGV